MTQLFLLLIGLLLAVIPFSERYFTLDNFPKGQDFETNMIALLAVFGLMLLFAHIFSEGFAALLWEPHRIPCSSLSSSAISSPSQRGIDLANSFALRLAHRIPLPDPGSGGSGLQLLI